eukprot:CAMPEP_0184652390 /NCGR_PEP_ID=MMETSP0308-20130426/10078_1 /TAXON_ID=38269 /ORGANISM="Gloeochaete witrockiana, Strain SAG 46.84" /LENGTH=507 /DNA_ID=CAMNT_0027087233 /DNA_START=57 /DNA_END=1577 /DNA_ORIENTATION=-
MRAAAWAAYPIALLIRLGLIVIGTRLDNSPIQGVKYTDVDYGVFSDAAKHVAAGRSPYDCAEYRYSPLLAWLLVPNVWLNPAFGKVLFCFADILVAEVLRSILRLRPSTSRNAYDNYVWCWWLFNPVVITISTRGNSDALIVLAVLTSLFLVLKGKTFLAAVVYGFSVHFRTYPIIYSLPFLLFIDHHPKVRRKRTFKGSTIKWKGSESDDPEQRDGTEQTVPTPSSSKVLSPTKRPPLPSLRQRKQGEKVDSEDEPERAVQEISLAKPRSPSAIEVSTNDDAVVPSLAPEVLHVQTSVPDSVPELALRQPRLITWRRLMFMAVSAGTFFAITAICYRRYGWNFLYEAHIYHFERTDPKHNFSPYFYPLQYASTLSTPIYGLQPDTARRALGLLALLPQASLVLLVAVAFYRDLPFCMMLQTVLFVALNKVCTVQYFVWYFGLAPIVLAFSALRWRWRGAFLTALWFASMGLWLFWAFRLEMMKEDVVLVVWGCSVLFSLVNCFIVW